MTTGQDIADDVRSIFGDTLTVQITDPDLIRWINDGMLKMARILETFTSVSSTAVNEGVESIPLPAGFLKLYTATIGLAPGQPDPGKELLITTLEAVNSIDQYRYNQNSFALPQRIYRIGEALALHPIPDQAYPLKLDYAERPSPVADLADNLIGISDTYIPDLKQFVLARCYEADDNMQAADSREKKFESQVNLSKDELRWTDANTYPSIRDVDGDTYGDFYQ